MASVDKSSALSIQIINPGIPLIIPLLSLTGLGFIKPSFNISPQSSISNDLLIFNGDMVI